MEQTRTATPSETNTAYILSYENLFLGAVLYTVLSMSSVRAGGSSEEAETLAASQKVTLLPETS